MSQVLRQSTQVIVVIGPFVDVGDGFTPETGITLGAADEAEALKANTTTTTDISAATWAAITGCDGYYGLTLTTSHTDTVGALTIMVNDDSVCLPVFARFQVIEEAAYDSFYAASAAPKTGINVSSLDANVITATSIAADALTAAKIANGAIDAATFAADVDAEILSYLVDDATRIDASALNTASATTIPAIVADTNELQTDWANGGRLDLIVDATLADTNELQVDWVNGGRLDLLLDATLADTNELQTDWADGGRLDLLVDAILLDTGTTLDGKVDAVDTVVDAIKAKTDSLTFTTAGEVDANIQSVNDVVVNGDGAGTPWGP